MGRCDANGSLFVKWLLLLSVNVLRVVAVIMTFGAGQACAEDTPRRIVSINVCTDQLLFKLADREQIAALSTLAADPGYTIYAAEVRASGLPLIRGSAEEVLLLKPDLVLASVWSRSATRQQIKARNIPVVELSPEENIASTKATIRRIAQLTGHEDRGEALIAEIDTALDVARLKKREHPITILQVQRRGFTSGDNTLTGELIKQLGAKNAAGKLGITNVGRAPLELILKAKPDALIVLQSSSDARDQGTALLQHRAMTAMYPPERRILLPNQLTVCGGPTVPEAIRTLAQGLQRID